MVRLEQIMSDDFESVRWDDPAEQVALLLSNSTAMRVIVRRSHNGTWYYHLLETEKAIRSLAGQVDSDLDSVLELNESNAPPLISAISDAETSPDICIVHRDGEPVGYYDASVLVETYRSSKDITRHAQPRFLQESVRNTETKAIVVRNIHARFPEKVPQKEIASLLVSLERLSIGGTAAPVAVKKGLIDIVVQPEKGFELEGPGEGQLRVTDEDTSLPLQFKLRATELGTGFVTVFCFQGGLPLASVPIYATVVQPGESLGKPATAKNTLTSTPPREADLMLLIRDWQGQHGTCLEFTLKSSDPEIGLNFKRFYSPPFQGERQRYFSHLYLRLDLQLQAVAADELRPQLSSYGAKLYEELFPADLRQLMWKLRDRIETIHVLSKDPWIPWELLMMSGLEEDGRILEGLFLSEQFHLTRWLPEIARCPVLTMRNLAVVAPSTSGLLNAETERDHLLGFAAPKRQVVQIPATYIAVREELKKGIHDGWHFVGHASADSTTPAESQFELEDQPSLHARDISGVVKNCGIPSPLVFLNACQSGQGAMGLTGAGGWATTFIEAGAGAFIGTLWSVRDHSAGNFAKEFYDQLLNQVPVSEAAFKARQAAGITGLAYAVFADPFATVPA